MVQWHQRNSVFPHHKRKAQFLIIARFLGPGFNQFQNWNNQNEESSEGSDEEEKQETNKKPRPQEDDNEGWTDWKNGEDIRHRFSPKMKQGRIIHLGDGSELFTDRTAADGDEDDGADEIHNKDGEPYSSTDEDSDEEEDDKMEDDGIKDGSKAASKTTAVDAPDLVKTPETRHKSPTPAHAAPQPSSPW